LQKKKCVNVFRYDGYWNDIGRPDDYICALEDIEKLKGTFI
jgi:NDP-sugar pyrophosphorylase family protein